MLALVTPGAGIRAIQALVRRGPAHFVVEDAALLERLERSGAGSCSLVSDLISCVRDVYNPAVRTQTAVLLRQLRVALGAEQWCYAGVSLWEAVMPDFLWRFLDSLFQATDLARQLLDATTPKAIALTGSDSYLARALIAVAQTQGIRVDVIESRTPGWGAAFRARAIPYFGHFRDCLRAAGFDRKAQPVRRSPFVLLNHALRNFLVVEPVFRELQRRLSAERILVVQTGNNGEEEVKASGLTYRGFEGYASLAEGLEALSSIAAAVGFLTSGLWKERVAKAGIAWEGVPLEALAEMEISFELPRLLSNTVREIACARAMLIQENPALVVMTEDRSSFSRAVGLSARVIGVPCLMVQWGPIALNSAWLGRVAADVAAVEGEAAAEVVRACEDGADLRVVVVGQPKYDQLREQAVRASRVDTCGRFALDPERPIVLYAPHQVREESAQMRKNYVEEQNGAEEVVAVLHAVRALPGVQLVVKPHPNEGSEFHRKAIERHGSPDIHLVPKSEPVYPLLFVCDAVVARLSAVGLEGVLLGKPLVIVNLTGRPDPFPYVCGGVAVGAYRTGDVEPALRSALYDPETRARLAEQRPAFLRRHIMIGDVSATERMVDLALNLARDH